MHWDLFCRVVDNFGDVGVCWRLAADLASRGELVRLFIDDDRALAWMAPGGVAGVEVLAWAGASDAVDVGDVVVEAFGCDLPEAFVARMAQAASGRLQPGASRPGTPVWINLEYLSAEADVERSHGLMSPQFSGPAAGSDLKKWFFYPGFTPRTGGLLRESGLMEAQAAFVADRTRDNARAYLEALGAAPRPDEMVLLVFGYDMSRLPALLRSLGPIPKLLVVPRREPAGEPSPMLAAVTHAIAVVGDDPVRVCAVPYVSQPEFDRLLWSCDLNLVRGEDSFVRAGWAATPFVWQIYPQHDGVHEVKLDAFLTRFLQGAPVEISEAVRSLWMVWNGFDRSPRGAAIDAGAMQAWRSVCVAWRKGLLAQSDLTSQLIGFASERR